MDKKLMTTQIVKSLTPEFKPKSAIATPEFKPKSAIATPEFKPKSAIATPEFKPKSAIATPEFKPITQKKLSCPKVTFKIKKHSPPKNLLEIAEFLQKNFTLVDKILNKKTADGRVDSSLFELELFKLIESKFGDKIKGAEIRHWFDFYFTDENGNRLPVNIKFTTGKGADNACNMAALVYAYTDFQMDLDKKYKADKMATLLLEKLKNKNYNRSQRDYYFLVINKETKIVTINSIKGLSLFTPNANNLPFQICWGKKENQIYDFESIEKSVDRFISCIHKTPPSWRQNFIEKMQKEIVSPIPSLL